MHPYALLQGVAEYTGLAGGSGGGARAFHGWPITQWATEHRTPLLIAGAVLLSLWILRALVRRAY